MAAHGAKAEATTSLYITNGLNEYVPLQRRLQAPSDSQVTRF